MVHRLEREIVQPECSIDKSHQHCSLLQYVLVSNCLQKKKISQFGDMNGRLQKNAKCMETRVLVGDLLVA
jgi:hypothetical protein